MKVKVSGAAGPVLDYLVAKCWYSDRRVEVGAMGLRFGVEIQPGSGDQYYGWMQFQPSTRWSHGGPIIEREGIVVQKGNPLIFPKGNENGEYSEPLWIAGKMHGRTMLEAAMRCFVVSRLGEEVEVPEELA